MARDPENNDLEKNPELGFDFSPLWQDEEQSKLRIFDFVIVILQIITLVVVFLKK